MVKKLLLLLCMLLGMQAMYAQSFTQLWQTNTIGGDDNHIIKLKYDNEGNQYLLGSFNESVYVEDHDQYAPENSTATSYFLVKYSPDGNIRWATALNDEAQDGGRYEINDLFVSPNGLITIAGNYSRRLIIDGNIFQTGDSLNVFFARYDSYYTKPRWVKSIGVDSAHETAEALTIDNAGNFYFTGRLLGKNAFGNSNQTVFYKAYVAKFTSEGNLLWKTENTIDEELEKEASSYITNPDDYDAPKAKGKALKIDPDGNIIMVGELFSILYWDAKRIGETWMWDDMMVAKFTPSGELMWIDDVTSGYESKLMFKSMDLDKAGNIYLAGTTDDMVAYNDIVYFKEGLDYRGTAYVLKISNNGKGLWVNGVEDAVVEYPDYGDYAAGATDLKIRDDGKIYVTGFIQGNNPVAFDGIVVKAPRARSFDYPYDNYDRYMAEISTEGKWLWVQSEDGKYFKNYNARLSFNPKGEIIIANNYKVEKDEPVNGEYPSMSGTEIKLRGLKINSIDENPGSMSITSFTLVDAETNMDVMTINDGDEIYMFQLPAKYNIRANGNPLNVGSVVFTFGQFGEYKRTESEFPYALAGDNKGDYYAMPTLKDGKYVLEAIPYSQAGGKGIKGQGKVIVFDIFRNDQRGLSYTLVDAVKDTDIMKINEGDILYLDELPGKLNIRAEVMKPGPVGSVRLHLWGYPVRIENEAPYAVAGDRRGDYHAIMPALKPGSYNLDGSSYKEANAQVLDQWTQLHFKVMASRSAKLSNNNNNSGATITDKSQFTAYPNPFTDKVTFEVIARQAGTVKLEVYDIQGRIVKSLFAGQMEEGEMQMFTFDGANLAGGVYIAKLLSGGEVSHQRVVLNK